MAMDSKVLKLCQYHARQEKQENEFDQKILQAIKSHRLGKRFTRQVMAAVLKENRGSGTG